MFFEEFSAVGSAMTIENGKQIVWLDLLAEDGLLLIYAGVSHSADKPILVVVASALP